MSDGSSHGARLIGSSGKNTGHVSKGKNMKTTALMAAIVAGFGLVATGAQAQDRPDFATLDADGNGQITLSELESQGAQRFATTDTDGDGVLSEAELLAQAEARSEGRAAKMVERMLAHLDENEDGQIQESELPEPNSDRVERRFDRVDSDDDGSISEEEFDAAADRGRGDRDGGRGGKHGEGRGERGGRG
jgi:Ca2+-binding EF-hand superfamily protein